MFDFLFDAPAYVWVLFGLVIVACIFIVGDAQTIPPDDSRF